MRKVEERRLFPRYPAVSLVVDIAGQLYEVEDISLGGLRLRGRIEIQERSVPFLLCPNGPGEVDRKHGVRGQGIVVAHHGDSTALEFDGATLPLLKMVVRQASLELGIEPYALK
jgi:hypothetical protein